MEQLIDKGITTGPNELVFQGFYTYDAEAGNTGVEFRIDATAEEGSFCGFATDEETRELFETGTIRVNGFIDGELISFVKTYPDGYFINDAGIAEREGSRRPHAVEYFGTWDETENKYAGNYAVTIAQEWSDRYKGEYLVEEYTGYWEMRPVSR